MKILILKFYHFPKSKVLVPFLFLFLNYSLIAQGGFRLPHGVKKEKIKFELANNLIIIPVVLNGVELSFILDTGVSATIIFSLEDRNTLELKNASKIYIRGLGDEAPVEAVKSINNELKIGKSISSDHTVFLIFDESIDFSSRMGFPVHGIIGYDFFKKFILDINYSREVLTVNDPKFYNYKKCKKCYRPNLRLIDGKRPFMDVKHKTEKGMMNLNLLIDTGSGSALWLFENEELGIKAPQNSFEDFLGKGFSGDIYGRRSKISSFSIGDFVMKDVTTSFPDSIYIKGISVDNRQGSIGGSVLRKFNLIVDYPNQKISFKKNNSFYKRFYYNMSGLSIQHSGQHLVKKYSKTTPKKSTFKIEKESNGNIKSVVGQREYSLLYSLKPKYEIADVRPDSPADIAGLKKGDVVLAINGKNAYRYKLSDLNDLFYSNEGKRIKIKIERLGVEIEYVFYLKKVI
ncbi:aspartyl protease family protein [Aquimarina sp. 2201CG5-10]|uniref:aspartyl protease family protein n=1 Tax=Aquimarina callyspongiae TaxID=3098150 RepID=UPI002AB542FC|nr:aspartyl protease family protein [Aquimarina sp. 2201CG5-10]MDY8134239.1 aspartyl protease family protein [Aquimarina sp. 2201CG5-10]